MSSFPFQRIVVLGVTGSGKSTLAERLAKQLGLEFIELDALYWKPDWVAPSPEEFREKVDAATRIARWSLAGNYSAVRDIVWPRAQAVVWLDYPFPFVFWRQVHRIWTRWRTKELLWGTNREPLLVHFKLWSDDSLIHWLFKTYWKRKRQYPVLFTLPEYSHLKVIHLRTQHETDDWICSLD